MCINRPGAHCGRGQRIRLCLRRRRKSSATYVFLFSSLLESSIQEALASCGARRRPRDPPPAGHVCLLALSPPPPPLIPTSFSYCPLVSSPSSSIHFDPLVWMRARFSLSAVTFTTSNDSLSCVSFGKAIIPRQLLHDRVGSNLSTEKASLHAHF